jgi:hypothetical protein
LPIGVATRYKPDLRIIILRSANEFLIDHRVSSFVESVE